MRIIVAMFLLVPAVAFAVDGVREINQACAVNSGCFPGDSEGGFPVTIFEPGSYRLTSNLDTSVADSPASTQAIEVASPNVTVDLNGFTISGPTTCTGDPVASCSPLTLVAPFSTGVECNFSGKNVTIRNGTIKGMATSAIKCDGAVIESIIALENAAFGIQINTNDGLIIGSVARRNGGTGFFVQGQIRNSVAEGNGEFGINASSYSRVTGNTVRNNGDDGVLCDDCALLDNVISDNVGFGVLFSGRSIYGRNLFDGNTGGSLSGSALAVDVNRCAVGACP